MKSWLGILILSFLYSTADLKADETHTGPSSSTGRAEADADDPALSPSEEPVEEKYIPCNISGGVDKSEEVPAPRRAMVRAMILKSNPDDENSPWRVANPKDLLTKSKLTCTTLLYGANGRLVGRHAPSYANHFGCQEGVLRSMVPGAFLPEKPKMADSIRYFPIKPGPVDGKLPEQWLPTSCGMQDMPTVLPIHRPNGIHETAGYELRGEEWVKMTPTKSNLVALELLELEAPEEAKTCLTQKRKGLLSAEKMAGADGTPDATGTDRRDSLFGSEGLNSEGSQPTQGGYLELD
jgi:hypothetical protein